MISPYWLWGCQIVEPSHFLVTEQGNIQFQAILGKLIDEASRIIIEKLILDKLELLCFIVFISNRLKSITKILDPWWWTLISTKIVWMKVVVFWFADCFKWIVYEPMKWSQGSSVNIHSNTFLKSDSNDQKYSDNKNQAAVAPAVTFSTWLRLLIDFVFYSRTGGY